MKKKLIVLGMLFLLVACGGGAAEQAAVAPAEESESAADVEQEDAAAEADDEPAGETETDSESNGDTASETEAEAPATEAPEEDTSDNGGKPMSGTDPETGLPINPEEFSPGDTFLVRGTIISMNLTPSTNPEFLIQSPAERNYRIAAQGLTDIYYEDGSQLQPHQYRQGMKAEATVTFPANASLADTLETEDLTLLKEEE